VDIGFSDEQQQLRETFDSLLSRHCTLGHVRDAEPLGFDGKLWELLGGTGLVGLGVPESCGGGGGGLVELGIVAEACGGSLAPVPFVEAPVAARVIASFGGAAERVLERAAAGEGVLTFAPRPTRGGVARLVPFGAVADRVVGFDGAQLIVASATPPRWSRPNLGSGALSDVSMSPSETGEAVILAEGDEAQAGFGRALGEWRVLMAAALTGLAARALSIGVDYVKERHQFGRSIGSFQAVAHRLADVATEVDGARLLWQEAAWAIDEAEPNGHTLAQMAFLFSAEVAERAASWSLHFHGGYGFMLEYDVQLFYRRAKAWPLAPGARASVSQRFADDLFESGGGQRWIFG
jgi:alkylation response protein AidB-like acyl-CoA dehydrogenase